MIKTMIQKYLKFNKLYYKSFPNLVNNYNKEITNKIINYLIYNKKNKYLQCENSSKKIINVFNDKIFLFRKELFSTKQNQNKPNINEKISTYSLTSLIIKILPKQFHAYYRLGRFDKPIGWILLFLPCTWGLTVGYQFLDLEYLYRMSLFLFGAIVMRSCGCAINDIWDKDFDKNVERTKNRPIASGELTPKQALKFISLHFLIGLCILLQFKAKSIIVGFAITPLFIIYPLMKRITYFPQFFLGLCFNSGIFVGYTAINDTLSLTEVCPLYLAGICWTLIYDTFYGHMDKKDDIKVGIRGTALLFSENTKKISYVLLVIIFGLFSYFMDKRRKENFKQLNKNSNKKYISLQKAKNLSQIFLCISCLYLARLIKITDINNPKSCQKLFNKNIYFGFMLYLVLLIDNQIFNYK